MYTIRGGSSAPSPGYKRVTSVQGTPKKVHRAKRWKPLFSGLEYTGKRPHVLAAGVRTIKSAQLKYLFVKEVDISVHLVRDHKGLVRWESSSNIVTRETTPFSFPKMLMVGWVLWHINLCYLSPNPFFMQIVLFQTIQFSRSTQFNCQNSSNSV